MKKHVLPLALFTTAIAIPAQADILAIKGGVEAWYPEAKINGTNTGKNEFTPSVYVALEHFLPLVPNAKIRYTNNTTPSEFNTKVNQYDLIAYYEVLDNDLLSLDLGLNLQNFDVTLNNNSFNHWQPNLYGNVELGIPTTPLSIYSSVSFGEFDSTSTTDAEAGLLLTMGYILDIGFKAGYRVQDYDFNQSNGQAGKFFNRGFFVGAELAF